MTASRSNLPVLTGYLDLGPGVAVEVNDPNWGERTRAFVARCGVNPTPTVTFASSTMSRRRFLLLVVVVSLFLSSVAAAATTRRGGSGEGQS